MEYLSHKVMEMSFKVCLSPFDLIRKVTPKILRIPLIPIAVTLTILLLATVGTLSLLPFSVISIYESTME